MGIFERVFSWKLFLAFRIMLAGEWISCEGSECLRGDSMELLLASIIQKDAHSGHFTRMQWSRIALE